MGMFDYVSWRGRADWQTKDLGRLMQRFVICTDGKLYRGQLRIEREAAKPVSAADDASHFLPHTGWVSVYRVEDPTVLAADDTWIEYALKFIDGYLIEITPTSRRAATLEGTELAALAGITKPRLSYVDMLEQLGAARGLLQKTQAQPISEALNAQVNLFLETLQAQLLGRSERISDGD